ncbi:Fluoroacetate dehalogenase [Roseovarius litorisediminis]|uniref:Fluoroacetate dehalogenase n=1 Tax=Roseovarius litorisediminis TaxID=1312363 RepID=A0A1Y5RAK1_9RHOB|nr:alpha/beta hydrolase [Roseovarius litorisediminis]SLN12580.1 Fluoroacetate dehalogenase [Roseovarius litorisediminis]
MTLAFEIITLLAVSIVATWIYVQYRARRHEAQAEAEFPPLGQISVVDGHRVHAVVMGAGPDLVLIHGSSGNTRDMTHSLAPRLAENFRVIVFDRPGLGYTERINRSGASISQQADLLARAAHQLGAEKPIVLGHSYGGAVALAWAVENPAELSALVVLSGAAKPWKSGLTRFYKITSHPMLGPLVIPFLTAFVHDERVEKQIASIFAPQSAPDGYTSYVAPGLTLRRHSLRANAMQRANLLPEVEALHMRYGEIAVPTEILHGTEDTTVGLSIHAEPLARQIPDAVLTRLEGIGHMPQHVAKDDVVAAIHRVAIRAGLHPRP